MEANGKVVILGGGPAGLALAHACAEARQSFVLLERGAGLGGLAQTIRWNGCGSHDLGPHKIFTLDASLLERVKALIPAEGWLTREKRSRIYLNGYYLPYPPSPFSLLKVFGPYRFARMVTDYGLARVKSLLSAKEPESFEEDLTQRVGSQLYSVLFEPLAKKLWGPGSELDSKLSQGRVQTPKLGELLRGILGKKKNSSFEALQFIYPQGGLQRLWQSIQSQGQAWGEFLTNAEVRSLVVEGNRIGGIEYFDIAGKAAKQLKIGAEDYVFSTLPLKLLPAIFSRGLSAQTTKLIGEKVKLNDLLLVFLHIDCADLLTDSWVFVPDPSIIFHRLSEQESFDPGMTPHGSIVCCEIMSSESRPTGQKSDSELIDCCLKDMSRMGVGPFKVLAQRVIRLPQSYPVFSPGYEEALGAIFNELDGFANFRSVGRQGAFSYIGTLDAMDIGYGAARWLLGLGSQRKPSEWSGERERTRHYPVLD